MMKIALIFVVVIGLFSLNVGQPTTSLTDTCQIPCFDYTASHERARILANIASLASVVRASQNERNNALQDCDLSWANMAEYSSQKYLLGLDKLTWQEARDRCHSCGYALVKIETQEEMDFLRSWFHAAAVHRLPGTADGVHNYLWIDGTDEGHEDCWVWTYPHVTRFAPDEGFRFWGPGEPSNSDSREHCASIWYQIGWKGNDVPCSNQVAYLCEKAPGESVVMPSVEDVRGTSPCG